MKLTARFSGIRPVAIITGVVLVLSSAVVGVAYATCTVTFDGGIRYVTGSNSADTCTGSGANDVMNALQGADNFVGAAGSDEVHGNPGNDDLKGETGNDVVQDLAGADVDRACGGQDADTVDVYDGDNNDSAYAGLTAPGDSTHTDVPGEYVTSCPI